jgi:nucleoside-diphosphate-sugar epimerase
MSDAVMIAGGTGLIGANVCKLLRATGRPVRALVRAGSEVEPLADLGVELVEGDITSPDDVARAAEGTAVIINSAALLGGATQDLDASRAVNLDGSINCYDAAKAGGQRVVELLTTTFFEHVEPLTERSKALEQVSDDAYTVTKAAAHREAMRRVDQGADIVFTIPGGTFGPSPTPARALAATSYNRLVRGAIRGKVSTYIAFPVPWVRAEDVASCVVAAADRGETGATYLAFGREDARTTAAFCNLACEAAGVEHRVSDVAVDPDDPDARRTYGDTLVELATRRWPEPWFDNSTTRAALDYAPVPLPEAMAETVAWLRSIGEIT